MGETLINTNTVKILFLASDPSDMSHNRLGKELQEIRNILKENDNFKLEDHQATKPRDILQVITKYKPQIVHFAGHGLETGEVCFEDDQGKSKPVALDALSYFFSLVSDYVKCVVLNTCYSERQAKTIALHIPIIIGTKTQIEDKAAIDFSVGFYTELESNLTIESIKKAFDFGRASMQFSSNTGQYLTPTLIFGAPELRFSSEVETELSTVSNVSATDVIIWKKTLSKKGEKMGLDPVTVLKIIQEKFKKVTDYNLNKKEYEQSLEDALRDEFPLSDETMRALNGLQNVLELRQEDIKFIERNVLSNPKWDSPEIWYDRGRVQASLQNYEKAILYFSKAIQQKPEYSGAYHERGFVYRKMGQNENAIDDYTKSIQINKSWEAGNYLSSAYFERGYVYFNHEVNDSKKRDENMSKALYDWSKTIELSPKYGAAYYNKALVLDYFNKFDDAIKDYETALQYEPYNQKNRERAKVLARLAKIYSSIGNEPHANEITKEALELIDNKNESDLLEDEFKF